MNQRNCSRAPQNLRDWEGVQTVPREVRASPACVVDPSSVACMLLVSAAPEIGKLRTGWHRSALVLMPGCATFVAIQLQTPFLAVFYVCWGNADFQAPTLHPGDIA